MRSSEVVFGRLVWGWFGIAREGLVARDTELSGGEGHGGRRGGLLG